MSLSLYRKYRPQSFGDVVGQNTVVQTLLNQSKRDEFSHAYLFTGPRGVGKTTVARLLAKAATAEKKKKDGDIDNNSKTAKLINEGKAIDLIEIDAASHTGVDHVRSVIIENSRTNPSVLKYKVFIIDEVHMLSGSAFNALLKTLEEPPAHAMFILATTEVHKVPETIISRCQRFTFHRIGIDDLVGRLEKIAKAEKISVEKEVLQEVATRAEGSSRDAESLLGQLMAFGEKKITKAQADIILPRSHMKDVAAFVSLLINKDTKGAIDFISSFVEEGGSAEQFLPDVITYIRMMLLATVKSKKLDSFVSSKLPPQVYTVLTSDVRRVSQGELLRMLEIFITSGKQFVFQDIPQLPLEVAVYEILQRASDDDTTPPAQPPSGTSALVSEKHEAKKPVTPKKTFTPSEVSFALIKEKWQDFINQIREINRGLSMSMQVARPVDISGKTVTIAVPYSFHKERISIPQHRHLIEEHLGQYFGIGLKLKCEVQAINAEAPQANVEEVKQDDVLWNQVMDAFGDQLAGSK